ncbi:uncharacterized protein LOC142590452 isoform X1 [Dermacentor variabilis]|uniref:uncharacterized protein LOC142590452 isoform X1 n=1 Tax=Dermacentor variabilis TaxID=34621 RepID=UPI003F5C6343
MSLAESITAKRVRHAPSRVVGQVEVGLQHSLPLADKSVGCSLKPGSESRSVQTTEAVEQLSSTSASRPLISASTAKCDNSEQGCFHQCQLCDYETDELFLLEEHASDHTGKKLFHCPLCPQSFPQKQRLKTHLLTHTIKTPFQCTSCFRCFSDKARLKDHLRIHTGEKPFHCLLCPQSFSLKSNLKTHLLTHTGEKPYECPSCSQRFSRKSYMKAHLHTHTSAKPYQCPSCSQSFSRKTSLKEHLCSHTGEKPYQCPSCSRGFSRKGDLKMHLLTHSGEKPFECPSCSQAFSRKYHLKVHLVTHTSEKPFDCPSCCQSFSRKSNLKVHLRTHTGEKPFQCPSCSRSFSKKTSLKEHLHSHTETSQEMDIFPSKRPREAINLNEENGKKRTKTKPTPSAKQLRLETQSTVEVELAAHIEEVTPSSCTCCNDGCGVHDQLEQTRAENALLREELLAQKSSFIKKTEELKKKLNDVLHRNAELERALTSKIFTSESKIIYARSLDVVVGTEAPVHSRSSGLGAKDLGLHSHSRSHSEANKSSHHKGTTAAVASAASVQERVSQQLEPSNRPSGASDTEAFQPSVSQDLQNSTEQVLPHELEPGPSQELEEALPSDLPEVFYTVIGSERDDGMLYAGSGKWLEKKAWDTLFRSPTDSLFCRMATNVFWTPKQQRSRSVTGTLSNKSRALGETKPRPALTPEKVASLKALFSIYMGSDVPKDTQSKRLKDVRRHLAQKLGDIRRI